MAYNGQRRPRGDDREQWKLFFLVNAEKGIERFPEEYKKYGELEATPPPLPPVSEVKPTKPTKKVAKVEPVEQESYTPIPPEIIKGRIFFSQGPLLKDYEYKAEYNEDLEAFVKSTEDWVRSTFNGFSIKITSKPTDPLNTITLTKESGLPDDSDYYKTDPIPGITKLIKVSKEVRQGNKFWSKRLDMFLSIVSVDRTNDLLKIRISDNSSFTNAEIKTIRKREFESYEPCEIALSVIQLGSMPITILAKEDLWAQSQGYQKPINQ